MRSQVAPLLVLFFLTLCTSIHAQQLVAVTPPVSQNSTTLPQLENCVRERYARALEADLAALEYNQKGEWLKYLPNLGITYTVAGDPRPAVSTSTNVFYQARRDKKVRAANRTSIIKRNTLALDTELAALRRLWSRYQNAVAKLDAYADVAQIDRDLFGLYEKQYAAKEIMPETFLLKKKAFLLQEIKRQEEQEKLGILWFQITDTAGCF